MQSCLIPPIMIVPLKNMLAMSLCPLNVSRLQESSPHWLYLMSPCSFIQMRLPSPQIVSCLRQSSYVCHGQWYMYLILYMYTIANSNLCIIRSLTPSHVTWPNCCLMNWTLGSLVMNTGLIEIGLCQLLLVCHYASVRMCRRHTVVSLCMCVCVCVCICMSATWISKTAANWTLVSAL